MEKRYYSVFSGSQLTSFFGHIILLNQLTKTQITAVATVGMMDWWKPYDLLQSLIFRLLSKPKPFIPFSLHESALFKATQMFPLYYTCGKVFKFTINDPSKME